MYGAAEPEFYFFNPEYADFRYTVEGRQSERLWNCQQRSFAARERFTCFAL